MRAILPWFFAIVFATAVATIQADMKPQQNVFDGSIFSDLSKADALKKAQEMAETDFARNVYRVLVVGKRPTNSPYDVYLKEKYGVGTVPIAGCVVSAGLIGAQTGYNSTMRPLLNRKFGRDIFKEAEEASRR